MINGQAGVSDEIHLLEPHDLFRDYFQLLELGLTNAWRRLLICSVLTRIRLFQPQDWKISVLSGGRELFVE